MSYKFVANGQLSQSDGYATGYDSALRGEKGEPWRRPFMSDTATAFAILALADSE